MVEYERKNRIDQALSVRNMKAIELAEKAGVSRGALSSWISQRWQPKQKPLMKMAKILEVSEMWLAGYDVPMERPAEQIKMDNLAQLVNVLRKDERLTNLVINMSKLNKEQLKTIESMVNELTKLNQ